MFHSRIHPEQYSNTLSDTQLKQLHTSLLHICSTAVDLLADSSKFPEEWLFKHRWDKGKKDQKNELPNGEKIVHITVGGRTSAVVPSLQKKTGPVAGDVKSEDIDGDISHESEEREDKPAKKSKTSSKAAREQKPAKKSKTSSKAAREDNPQHTGIQITARPTKRRRTKETEMDTEDSVTTPAKKRKGASKSEAGPFVKDGNTKNAKPRNMSASAEDKDAPSGRRRSTRVAAGRV